MYLNKVNCFYLEYTVQGPSIYRKSLQKSQKNIKKSEKIYLNKVNCFYLKYTVQGPSIYKNLLKKLTQKTLKNQ